MKIRKIEKKDDARMADIVRRNFISYDLAIPGTAYFDPQLDTLAEYYDDEKNQGQYFVIVDENDEVFGGAGLGKFKDIENCCELQKLYFDDSIKGQGLSKILMAHIEEVAKSLEYEKIYIETHSKLDKALNLYVKMGYEPIKKPDFVQHSAMDRFFIKKI